MRPETFAYATHPTAKGPRELLADFYRPAAGDPADLIVWMHSGGFRSGSREHRNHARLAAGFGRHGYAMAFIDYRLARPTATPRPQTAALLPALVADAVAAGEPMHETFYGPRALAVVEDCCAFLVHADARRATLGLSGRYLLGGSSAGAISALNTLYLAQPLGLARPSVATVLAFSGGFAYPSFAAPTGARILALHSPGDERVPIASIRRLAAASPDPVRLIENDRHAHGELQVTPEEPLAEAIARCVTFDRAGAAGDNPAGAGAPQEQTVRC